MSNAANNWLVWNIQHMIKSTRQVPLFSDVLLNTRLENIIWPKLSEKEEINLCLFACIIDFTSVQKIV